MSSVTVSSWHITAQHEQIKISINTIANNRIVPDNMAEYIIHIDIFYWSLYCRCDSWFAGIKISLDIEIFDWAGRVSSPNMDRGHGDDQDQNNNLESN